MTRAKGVKPRLPKETEEEIFNAWYSDGNWRGIERPTAKELAGKLEERGHPGGYRSVQRRYADYRAVDAARKGIPFGSRWRLTDAHSAEELALIVPALVSSAQKGGELTKDEAAVFLAFRRALPRRHPDLLLCLAHHCERARRREVSAFPSTWAPYTVDEIEEWVAFAHRDQEEPGLLERATEAGVVRKIGAWVASGTSLAEPRSHSCGREFSTSENLARHAKDCDGTPIQGTSDRKRKGGAGK